jgi:uncharacterized protein (TIGR02646 family)
MIKVAKPDVTDTEWVEISREALAARKDLENAFNKTGKCKIDDVLYKKYMKYLLSLFNGKCAYCESDIASNQPGDVEHFRPKSGVVDDHFKPIRVHDEKWGDINHPGYYWLAYDWKNLFPACPDCNRYRKHGSTKDSGAGKGGRFPVQGFRAAAPGQEAREQPLLVNPSETDPDDHFTFTESGKIEAKTPMGESTLKCLGLNRREQLLIARGLAYQEARLLLRGYLNAVIADGASVAADRDRINNIWNGRRPYSAMQRLAFEAERKRVAANGISMPLPLS